MLDARERYATQDPGHLWDLVGLHEGDVVVDVGAGTGFFAFPASSRVGEQGSVYAVDVSEDLLDLIGERAEAGHFRNLHTVLSTPTRIPLEDGTADVVLLANVLHGVPPSTVAEAVRVLRPGGRLVNVDWKKRETPQGPPVRHRLSPAEASAALRAYGVKRQSSFDLGPYHYVLVFLRPAPGRRPGHLVSAE